MKEEKNNSILYLNQSIGYFFELFSPFTLTELSDCFEGIFLVNGIQALVHFRIPLESCIV